MRFLRHLAAVALLVAVVVAGGLAWGHFGASTLAGGFRGPVKVVNVPGGLLKGLPPGTAVAACGPARTDPWSSAIAAG